MTKAALKEKYTEWYRSITKLSKRQDEIWTELLQSRPGGHEGIGG